MNEVKGFLLMYIVYREIEEGGFFQCKEAL